MSDFLELLKNWGAFGAFLVALIDGAGLPNPGGPDYLLLFLGWKSPDTAYWAATTALAGSILGIMILYWVARKGGEKYLEKRAAGPRAMRFRRWFERYGLVTVFIPALVPLVPLPLKFFVVCAGAMGVGPLTFLVTILLGRLPRYFGLAWVARSLSDDPRGWMRAHTWDFALAAAVLVVFSFILVKLSERFRTPRAID
ncbi:MAG: VTT domain-containing protein [Bryobacteraceae bacterium]|nr:VTT domain-containing protein [Bryobacteraceae bacterium]